MTKNHKIQFGIVSLVALWLVGSTIVSQTGLFNQPNQPPVYFGLFLGVPMLGFLLAYAFSKSIKQALLAVPLWIVVGLHIFRFAGIFLVIDGISHTLPPLFGWSAGIGDIISATVSIPLALALRRGDHSKQLHTRFIVWNIFGLTDLFNAITLGLLYSVSVVGILSRPGLNSQLITFLPHSIIPTFYVPLLILLHLLALRRNKETGL
jgi:hypothetical protein